MYPCPEKLEERRDMLANLGARIADLQIVSVVNLLVNRLHAVQLHTQHLRDKAIVHYSLW